MAKLATITIYKWDTEITCHVTGCREVNGLRGTYSAELKRRIVNRALRHLKDSHALTALECDLHFQDKRPYSMRGTP